MEPGIVINVEVTISDALRRLLGGGGSRIQGADASVAPHCRPAYPALSSGPELQAGWQKIVLRRDGQWPLKFNGVLIFRCSCHAEDGAGQSEQALALYLASDRTVYASLTFTPADTTPAQPAHRCRPVADTAEFARFVQDWRPELSFDSAACQRRKTPCDPAAVHAGVRSAFNAMIADRVQSGLLSEQGKS